MGVEIVKGFIMLLAAGLLLSGCGNELDVEQVESQEEQLETANKLLEKTDGHTKGAFERLPAETREYIKENPDLLRKFTQGEPTFMGIIDTLRLGTNVKLGPEDIQLVYDTLENNSEEAIYENGMKFSDSFIAKLKSN
ncbi:hypothetical protein [Halobacillus amylolyticus]|uniref:Lipoprotein n=1 Tax=Halobacillus amylolyticus TaxID=2932259 RepID=A0ABY4HG55_9BACI|nr:hypothetical protein [Halobacillus amylolyticus]UOR12855.1 hypothetical protein MUO15_04915 [Halobacillus amylolyticus]